MTRFAMRLSMVLALVAGTPGLNAAVAEEASATASGARIRVTAPSLSGKRLVGTLTRMDATTLTLWQENGKRTLEVPRSAITRLEVSRHSSRRGKGAGIGALVGIGAAVVIGVAGGDDCNFPPARPEELDLGERLNRSFCFGRGEIALAASLLTVPLGTLLGYAAAPGERWAPTAPERLRVAVSPLRGGGVGAKLSVRF
jgi:hypothetical protein